METIFDEFRRGIKGMTLWKQEKRGEEKVHAQKEK